MRLGRSIIRKRIEIVSCMWVGLIVGAANAQSVPDEARGWLRLSSTAQSFPVYTEPASQPLPLEAPEDVDDSSFPSSEKDEGTFAPDISFDYFWSAQDGLRLRSEAYSRREPISEHSPGLLGGFQQRWVETPGTRWQPRPSGGGWSAAAARWGARLDEQTELALGNSEISTPLWNEGVTLSGVSLSQSFLATNEEVSQWNYALAFGAVDQSASGANDLEFGPTAGALALNYDYDSRLSMGARTEVAADLVMSGVSGQYDLGWLGRWRSGVARSTRGEQQGWRYRAAADFSVAEDVNLVWMGERHTEGFMDIRRYAGNSSASGGRQRWSASWDVGRWGTWSGSFETVYGREGTEARRIGLSQQFWYTPRLRVGLHAEREVIAGDYDIGLRFTFPLY